MSLLRLDFSSFTGLRIARLIEAFSVRDDNHLTRRSHLKTLSLWSHREPFRRLPAFVATLGHGWGARPTQALPERSGGCDPFPRNDSLSQGLGTWTSAGWSLITWFLCR